MLNHRTNEWDEGNKGLFDIKNEEEKIQNSNKNRNR